jgi:hypothetical protein
VSIVPPSLADQLRAGLCQAIPALRNMATDKHAAVVRLLVAADGLEPTRGMELRVDAAATLPTAGLYVRLFIIQHDCGHGSYFAGRRANQWLGACLGLITLFPSLRAVHVRASVLVAESKLGSDPSRARRKLALRLAASRALVYRRHRLPPHSSPRAACSELSLARRLPVHLAAAVRAQTYASDQSPVRAHEALG